MREYYKTWQEASKAAIALGIKTADGYNRSYIHDPLLHSKPRLIYADFPGFSTFLGFTDKRYHTPRKGKMGFYRDWRRAVSSAQRLGIDKCSEWVTRFHEDPRLPSNPYNYYKGQGFPGFPLSKKLKKA